MTSIEVRGLGDNDSESKDMLLRALRMYSDTCEAPSLHPDCPFSEDVGPHERGCGEQCQDLLANNAAPQRSSMREIEEGLRIRRRERPRPRHSSVRDNPPFDAYQTAITEKERSKDFRYWSLTTLLRELGELLISSLEIDRAACIAIYEQIRSRGIEDEHIMILVRELFVARFVSSQISNLLESADEPEAALQELPNLLPNGIRKIAPWTTDRSFEELLGDLPSDIDALESTDYLSAPPMGVGRWLIERFTKTYLREWTTSSLHYEWKYIHGLQAAPCRPSEMRSRIVAVDRLAIAIAERSVADGEAIRSVAPAAISSQLVSEAIGHLRQGRRREAAALFEGIALAYTDDPHTLNNLAFCLMIDDPERALTHLIRSDEISDSPLIINRLNRSLCLALLGRKTTALDIVSEVVDELNDDRSEPEEYAACMWDPNSAIEDSDAVLIDNVQLDEYASQLLGAIRQSISRNA